jgi:hypothetical protein
VKWEGVLSSYSNTALLTPTYVPGVGVARIMHMCGSRMVSEAKDVRQRVA